MPPKETRWNAEPHTIAKHAIYRKYLAGWLPTSARWNNRLIFIDGFAGPGEYETGEEGSPIITLRDAARAQLLRQHGQDRVHLRVHRRARGSDRVPGGDGTPKLGTLPESVRVECSADSFNVAMNQILDGLEDAGHRLAPTFAFVDPFGFSDTPMELITRILTHPRSEVFVTVMLEHVNRFLAHPEPKIAKNYDALFGDPGYRDLIGIDAQSIFPSLTSGRMLLEIYRCWMQHAGPTWFESR